MQYHCRSNLASCTYSELLLRHKGFEPLLEVFLTQLLTLPLLLDSVNALWWNQDVADDLNDAIGCDSVFNGHICKAVDLDADKTTKASDVDAQRLVFEQGREVDLIKMSATAWRKIINQQTYMEIALRNAGLINAISLVKRI